ncbi:hypothetical protein AAG906_024652 [Vitis piasezkii]
MISKTYLPEAKQQKMSLDWEESFNLFEEAVASESTAMQIQAIIKVAQLSNYAPDNVLTRAVPILTQLLGGSSSPLVQAAAYCLKCIAHQGDRDDRLATLIGQSGVLVKFLWSIVTFGTHNRVIVVRNGGFEVIINMLGSCVGSTRRHLLEILSALVWLREVRRVITSLEGLQFLVEAVKFGGMASRERAAYAVGSLGVARSARTALVDLGAMQALMDWQRTGVISAHVDCIRPLAQAGAIPLYAELLRGAEPVGKEIAEDVFCVLAIAEVNAVSIAQHLAQILRENDDIAKAAAAEILGHLSRYKHSVPFITNSGAIPVLVELLRQGSDEVKEKASGAIAQLSYNAGDRAALADAGAIPILMDLLGDDQSEELRNKAAEALISFSFNITSFQDIHNRLAQLRAPDNNGEHMARPSRRMMSMEQLPWDPNIL